MDRTRIRRPARFAAALAAVAALTAPAAAHAARGMEVGLQDDAVLVGQAPPGRSAGLNRARELGVNTIRVNVHWAGTLGDQARLARAPAAPRYDFERYDALVGDAAARGIAVQLTLTGPAPRWATGDRKVSAVRPRPAAFAGFARAAVAHFRGRIGRYGIWNEPNWFSSLRPQRTAAAQYRALYLAGYRAVKASDPSARVLFGELAPQRRAGLAIAPLAFTRAVLCVNARWRRSAACRGVLTDGFAQHPYDFTHAPTNTRIPRDDVTIGTLGHLAGALGRLRRAGALTTRAGAAPPVYLTEFGYFATGFRRMAPAARARNTVGAFTIARAAPAVRQLVYYQLFQTLEERFNTGLISAAGVADRPFVALRAWVAGQRARGLVAPLGAPSAPRFGQ